MTKSEFLAKINQEQPNIAPFSIEIGKMINKPFIVGCYNDKGTWKVYDTNERGDVFINLDTDDEGKAFGYLYTWVAAKKS